MDSVDGKRAAGELDARGDGAGGEETAKSARRFFVGIGVGSYDDAELDLPHAESDVAKVAEWFTQRCGVEHSHELKDLAKSPRVSQVLESLREFLQQRGGDDVVVIFIACHGELDGTRAHLFGRNTPRKALAGLSIDATTLGTMLGQGKAHNLLLIIDACVAGRLASHIQRAVEDAADHDATREPRRHHAQIIVSSTYGRDPAFDGRFVEAFLSVVSDERWTGTSNRWIEVGQLVDGLQEELKDLGVPQVVEQRYWSVGKAELIPNPNVASRQLGQLISDAEFQAHFDPSARGVARGETGSFFTGREHELKRVVDWLAGQDEQ